MLAQVNQRQPGEPRRVCAPDGHPLLGMTELTPPVRQRRDGHGPARDDRATAWGILVVLGRLFSRSGHRLSVPAVSPTAVGGGDAAHRRAASPVPVVRRKRGARARTGAVGWCLLARTGLPSAPRASGVRVGPRSRVPLSHVRRACSALQCSGGPSQGFAASATSATVRAAVRSAVRPAAVMSVTWASVRRGWRAPAAQAAWAMSCPETAFPSPSHHS